MLPILFFENGFSVQTDDAFFLDTNTVVSFLCEEDPYHLASIVYITYLIMRKASVFINEVVVMEALNIIARKHYVADAYRERVVKHGEVEHPTRMRRELQSGWYANIVKRDDERLSRFNKLACEQLMFIINFCRLSPATPETIRQGLAHSYGIPLASADALIAAAAERHHAALISFDRDMDKLPNATIYKTSLRNHFVRLHARSIMDSLDPHLYSFLQATLGLDEFNRLFSNKKGTLI